jgi:hypothetical protein
MRLGTDGEPRLYQGVLGESHDASLEEELHNGDSEESTDRSHDREYPWRAIPRLVPHRIR